jgi:hypothetical protein
VHSGHQSENAKIIEILCSPNALQLAECVWHYSPDNNDTKDGYTVERQYMIYETTSIIRAPGNYTNVLIVCKKVSIVAQKSKYFPVSLY